MNGIAIRHRRATLAGILLLAVLCVQANEKASDITADFLQIYTELRKHGGLTGTPE